MHQADKNGKCIAGQCGHIATRKATAQVRRSLNMLFNCPTQGCGVGVGRSRQIWPESESVKICRLRLRLLLLLLLLLPLGAAMEPRHSPGGAPCGGGSLRPRPRRRRRLSSPVAAGGWSPEGEDGSPPGTGTSAARVPASPPPLYRRGSERLGSPRRCSQHRCRLARRPMRCRYDSARPQ